MQRPALNPFPILGWGSSGPMALDEFKPLKSDGIASLARIRWCNVLAASGELVIRKLETRNFVNRESVDYIGQ